MLTISAFTCRNWTSMRMGFGIGCFVLIFLHSLPCISSGYDLDNTGNHDSCCFAPPHTSVSWLGLLSGGGQATVTGVILVITLLNIIVYKLRQLQETRKPSTFSSQHLCRQFLLVEMRLATNNFDEALMIGKGGFGKVYRGVIDHGAITVAIKRLDSRSKQGASEFWTEIKMLSNFRHTHLVSLIGYCEEFNEMIVVYEYVSGGNLGERLHKATQPCLSWVERLKICIGAARALDYLHTGTGIRHGVIHRDVKTSNILLDEHMAAKLSDLGVSKIGPVDQDQVCTHVSTDVKGSFGYFDPNYFLTRRLTRKSDVYSFGVVLLEVLCGRPAVDTSLGDDELGLVSWAQRCIREGMLKHIIDEDLMGQVTPECLKLFVEIGEKCLRTSPNHRPTMAEVVVGLEAALALQQKPPSSTYSNQERTNSYIKSGKIITFSRILRHMLVGDLKKKKGGHKQVVNREAFSVAESGLKVLSLGGLKIATRNFSDDMMVGEGAFGKVFKGWLDKESYLPSKVGSGIPVAVKKLNMDGYQGMEEWQAEVKILGRLRHPNLVKLLGHCSEDKELLLVYEFMEKGSLENYILKKGFVLPLPWSLRLKILIGAAQGIEFLHTTENGIIFRDLKSSNILLDQDFNAKLADFGLAIHGPINGDAHLSTLVFGTYGYAAPEYVATGCKFTTHQTIVISLFMCPKMYHRNKCAGHLNGKIDIYAFGVVLLETLTGLRVFDKTRPKKEQNLVGWMRPMLSSKRKLKTLVDPTLGEDYPPQAAFQCATLVLKCTQPDPKQRPSIQQVVETLQQISRIKNKSLLDYI